MSRIIRVFPRRTAATPDDDLARTGRPFLWDEADEVHVSVAFTYDLPAAEALAADWRHVAPTTIGGPATGQRSEEFVPGRYLRPGYTITSRGCPNRCWFCSVWRREGGDVRELPIEPGWNVLDDNILATSRGHFAAVCAMLGAQPHPAEFTGGLEAARLTPWHATRLYDLRPKQLFFAYDTPDDLEPLVKAGKTLREAGFQPHPRSHVLRCYVLCGWPRDTMPAAETRMRETVAAGYMPMAMLYRNAGGHTQPEWRRFQREWARPQIVAAKMID